MLQLHAITTHETQIDSHVNVLMILGHLIDTLFAEYFIGMKPESIDGFAKLAYICYGPCSCNNVECYLFWDDAMSNLDTSKLQ